MVTYMISPRVQVTFGSTVTEGLVSAVIELSENAYWTAQLTFNNDPAVYPTPADKGETVLVEVQDNLVGGAWTTLFNGTVLFPQTTSDDSGAYVIFQCVGTGYALNMMNCAEEYGIQSRNPARDSVLGILTNASVGVIPQWVNKYKATANDSGYSINTDNVEDLAGSIPFISFPWKPADKCLDDLCDLSTAISQTSSLAGPHWICDHDSKLRVKRIGATQLGWTNYYGDSQAAATLTDGIDFLDNDSQTASKQANVVLYYGLWRRPSSGDAWTENNASSWGSSTAGQPVDDAVNHRVGLYSVKLTDTDNVAWYPADHDAAWNFNSFSDFNVPHLNFHILKHGAPASVAVRLYTTYNLMANYYMYALQSEMANDDTWYHFSLPLGQYYKTYDPAFEWTTVATAPDWSEINTVWFGWSGDAGDYICIDGLYVGDSAICRIARQEFPSEGGTLGQAGNEIRFKVFTDNTGKDDSLTATDDSGLLAQLAKAELLKLCSEPTNRKFSTPMIKDVLPGQYFYIGEDWRITKVTHTIGADGFRSKFEVTNDLTNSHARLRYEDVNKAYAANRPEWQDRQSSSIKTGALDIRVLPLEKAYDI